MHQARISYYLRKQASWLWALLAHADKQLSKFKLRLIRIQEAEKQAISLHSPVATDATWKTSETATKRPSGRHSRRNQPANRHGCP